METGLEGLEPPTYGFGNRRSTNWSYRPIVIQLFLFLFVGRMSPANPAELLQLQFRLLLRILTGAVIPVAALGTLKKNPFPHFNTNPLV